MSISLSESTTSYVTAPSVTSAYPTTYAIRARFTGSFSGDKYVFGQYDSSAGTRWLTISSYTNGSGIALAIFIRNGTTERTPGTTILTNDGWHDVVMVANNSTDIRLYLDGALEATYTGGTAFPAVDNLQVGASGDSTPQAAVAGDYADAVVWNIALNGGQISAYGNKAPIQRIAPQANLKLYWPMRSNNSSVADLSGNLVTGTINSGAYTDNPPVSFYIPMRDTLRRPVTAGGGGPIITTPGVGALTWAGIEPATVKTTSPPVATAAWAGVEPATIKSATPGIGTLSWAGIEPDTTKAATPQVGTLTWTGLAPEAETVTTPEVGVLTWAAVEPTIIKTSTPGVGAAAWTGIEPNAIKSDSPQIGQLAWSAVEPGTAKATTPEIGLLAWTGVSPVEALSGSLMMMKWWHSQRSL